MGSETSPRIRRRRCAMRASALAILSVGLLAAGCAGNEVAETGSTGAARVSAANGPIKAAATCPLTSEDLVPGHNVPHERLAAFEACVQRHTSNGDHIQASGWIRDWYTATSCIHKCEAKGNAEMAHQSMWTGLRYIASATLPAGDGVDRACRETQRALVVAIDEAMNNLVGWRGFSTTQCKSEASMEATLRKIAEATEYRNRLTARIAEFKSKRQ